jgi:hypothetical protein
MDTWRVFGGSVATGSGSVAVAFADGARFDGAFLVGAFFGVFGRFFVRLVFFDVAIGQPLTPRDVGQRKALPCEERPLSRGALLSTSDLFHSVLAPP